MATHNSPLIGKRTRHRGIYSGQPYQIVGRITLAEGTVLTAGDILQFAPIGENQRVNKVKAYIVGDLPSAAVSIGYTQILGKDGQPAKVERRGPFGEAEYTFTSPASDTDAFAAAAVLSTARETIDTDNTPGKLDGPVYLAAEVTTGGTVGAGGVEIYVGAEFDGEMAPPGTESSYDPDNDYLLGN